jgi:hypothetical protein
MVEVDPVFEMSYIILNLTKEMYNFIISSSYVSPIFQVRDKVTRECVAACFYVFIHTRMSLGVSTAVKISTVVLWVTTPCCPDDSCQLFFWDE